MAYTTDEAKVEQIARAWYEIYNGGAGGHAAAPDPNALVSLRADQFMTQEELWETYPSGPYPSSSQPNWKRYRRDGVLQYAAMHELGLV